MCKTRSRHEDENHHTTILYWAAGVRNTAVGNLRANAHRSSGDKFYRVLEEGQTSIKSRASESPIQSRLHASEQTAESDPFALMNVRPGLAKWSETCKCHMGLYGSIAAALISRTRRARLGDARDI